MNAATLRATKAWLRGRKVAVLKGGWSRERAVSLRTGAAVEAAFRRMGIRSVGIDMNRSVLARLEKLKIDFCFLALHGAFGEDGRIQSALDVLNIGYTGTGPQSSAIAMDKDVSKKLFIAADVPTAEWFVIHRDEAASDRRGVAARIEKLLHRGPVFVKPADQGSAIGASKVSSKGEIAAALKASFKAGESAIVERFVDGRELTVGILGDHVLPVIEILPQHDFYDYHSKYARGGSRHVVPAPISSALTRQVQDVALAAFRSVGCSVYGRVDVMLNRAGKPFVLEINTIPGMTATSLLPDAARAAGMDFDALVLTIVALSRDARRLRKSGLHGPG